MRLVDGIREKGGVLSNSGGSISKICWLASGNDELINRDKASLDIFWHRDENLEDSDNLSNPDVLAPEIVEDLEAALQQFCAIVSEFSGKQESELRCRQHINIDVVSRWIS